MPSSLPRTDKQIDSAKRAQTARLGTSGAAGKRKRCRKGKSCGASCIHSAKFCLVDLPWASNAIGSVRREIQERPRPSAQAPTPTSAPRPAPAPAPRPERPAPRPEPAPKREDNRSISEKLKDSLPKFDVEKKYNGILLVASQMIDGHKLEINFFNNSIGFTVDGTHASQNLPYRTSVKIANQVRIAAREFFKTVPEGSTFMVTAYTRDGKGQDRVDAYVRQGFSRVEVPGASQYGKVVNGKLVPATRGDYGTGPRYEFKEREESTHQDVVDWHIILFGNAPGDNKGKTR